MDAIRLQQERDLYRQLIDLSFHDDIEPLLEHTLEILASVAKARRIYLEIASAEGATPLGVASRGCSAEELEWVRSAISSSVVARMRASGQTIETDAAQLDPRFQQAHSVQQRDIQAVLCVPIGHGGEVGMLYLEAEAGAGVWSAEIRELVELSARFLAPLCERIVVRESIEGDPDGMERLRSQMNLDGVVGCSAALVDVLEQARIQAELDVPILLTGETGTGKSQLAQVIHRSGLRPDGPFVSVNLGAIQETLVESELFGAVKGAYTDAENKPGLVEQARGGTLFLDEIGDASPKIQIALLQLVQDGKFTPVGGKEKSADVRIVAATNVDLAEAIEEGRFRSDLYFRLAVLPIEIPPLRERREDVPLLARHFVRLKRRDGGVPLLNISPSAMAALAAAPWPGNTRELEHAIQRGMIRANAEGSDAIARRHFFPDAPADESETQVDTFHGGTAAYQEKLVRSTLEANGWNVSRAAVQLDIARSYLYKLMSLFGITRE